MNVQSSDGIFQLIYTSKPSVHLTEQSMIDILVKAQQYNQDEGISGFLLYSNTELVQLIEGDETAVKKLFQKIEKDTRHQDIVIRHISFTDARCMPFLGMGLCFMEGTHYPEHQFYFTQADAKRFTALISGEIGELFAKYLD